MKKVEDEFIKKIYYQKENFKIYINEFIESFDEKLKLNQNKMFESLKYINENFEKHKNDLIDIDIKASNIIAHEIATKLSIVNILTLLETNLHIIKKELIFFNPSFIFIKDSKDSILNNYNNFIIEKNNIHLDKSYKDLWLKINYVYRPIRNAIVHNFSDISDLREKKEVEKFIKNNEWLIHLQNNEIWFEYQFIKELAEDINKYLDNLFEEIIKFTKKII